ncbi:MAG: DUF421 domain-containing protein [Clostridiaceae bacterium]|nr:DUF421 domain-containing protein [Clostridiaceae bacterium]
MFKFIVTLLFMFSLLIITIRLLGKSLLAQITPHDFMTIVFLAYLAFSPIEVEGISQAIVGMILIATIYIVFSKLGFLPKFNKFIIGEPIFLIRHGKIITKNLRNARYPLVELISTTRAAGYPHIKDIQYAILEPNGALSIIPKKDVESGGLPVPVVIEGTLQHKNLHSLNKSEAWLEEQIRQQSCNNIEDILYASVNDIDYRLTIIEKKDSSL